MTVFDDITRENTDTRHHDETALAYFSRSGAPKPPALVRRLVGAHHCPAHGAIRSWLGFVRPSTISTGARSSSYSSTNCLPVADGLPEGRPETRAPIKSENSWGA
jgi:hypothetical protein